MYLPLIPTPELQLTLQVKRTVTRFVLLHRQRLLPIHHRLIPAVTAAVAVHQAVVAAAAARAVPDVEVINFDLEIRPVELVYMHLVQQTHGFFSTQKNVQDRQLMTDYKQHITI